MKEYRSMMKSEETLNFICTKCNDKEEETTSGPVNSTVITDVSDQPIPDYGTLNLSVISAANSTNNLNRTFTISRDPDQPTEADTTGAVDQPTEADTTGALDQPTEADTTGALDQPTEADTTGAPDTDVGPLRKTFSMPSEYTNILSRISITAEKQTRVGC
ncbi:uncharacterized protein [Mytilus edulis]|uniref:uncharacterized protein n=1 Tax=Mytilus edulis TaxID=6550 RepID=UPI0039F116B9